MPVAVQFSNQFASAKGHGIARYSREIRNAMVARGDWDIVVAAAWSTLPEGEARALLNGGHLQLTGLGRLATPILWSYLGFPKLERLLSGPVDLIHALSLGYPVATGKPFIVTIHDLGPLTHPHFFRNSRPGVMERALEHAVANAAAIICVSRSTADEVASYVGTSIAERLHVIYEGVSDAFSAPAAHVEVADLDLPPNGVPFILSAGAISPRKNLQALLRGLSKVRSAIPHHLVLVGGHGWDGEGIERSVRDLSLGDRVHFNGFVTDAQLRALYNRAELYAHLSLYEGFGLTVLEAMASGTPVLVSNRASLPEVAGDAGHSVDPDDEVAIGVALEEICSDTHLAADMVTRGRRHAAGFAWEICAEKTASLYRAVTT